jgi:general secretion pathway protein H
MLRSRAPYGSRAVSREYRRAGRSLVRTAGFTLIELMVVLMVIGVVAGMVTMSAAPSPQRELRADADRLAQLLSLAREEAQVRGAPIRFEADGSGCRVVVFRDREWRPITDDRDLRPRPWASETRVAVDRPDGRRVLEFGRDLVEAPYRVVLQRPEAAVSIVANGLGAFEVVD